MSDRPAENIEMLNNYLWWLLPDFLKKKDRSASMVGKFCEIWGGLLDESRTTLTAVVPQLLVETAVGEYLDRLARSRQIFRGVGETDDSLRTRTLAAHTIKKKGGTIPGMIEGLAAIGYVVLVLEPNRGTATWSRFVVRAIGWNGVVTDQSVFYQTVRELKPAHTMALVESWLLPGTWDDGGTLDDNGTLDDWRSI
jgi:hypothetical protein